MKIEGTFRLRSFGLPPGLTSGMHARGTLHVEGTEDIDTDVKVPMSPDAMRRYIETHGRDLSGPQEPWRVTIEIPEP